MLVLRDRDIAGLRAHAEQEYPRECCGVLLGRVNGSDRRVERLVRCRNARVEANRYAIDPGELIAVQKQARAEDLGILGFYHSHPDHPPQPSAADLEDAHWSGCCYLIVAVEKGKAVATRGFRLESVGETKLFVPEELAEFAE